MGEAAEVIDADVKTEEEGIEEDEEALTEEEREYRKIPITARSAVRRINRKLEACGRSGWKLKAHRGSLGAKELGAYYIVDLDTNMVVTRHVDLVAEARARDVLEPWERIGEDEDPSELSFRELARKALSSQTKILVTKDNLRQVYAVLPEYLQGRVTIGSLLIDWETRCLVLNPDPCTPGEGAFLFYNGHHGFSADAGAGYWREGRYENPTPGPWHALNLKTLRLREAVSEFSLGPFVWDGEGTVLETPPSPF